MQCFRHGLGEVSYHLVTAVFLPLTRLAKPETKKTLPLALLNCVNSLFVAAVIPRLFLIIFRYSQPILIKQSIRYVVDYSASAESSHGYWLFVSAVGIYVGLAVRTNS
jgi:ATP-binding cassette subfamily C (CFTR/MRP) protein 1